MVCRSGSGSVRYVLRTHVHRHGLRAFSVPLPCALPPASRPVRPPWGLPCLAARAALLPACGTLCRTLRRLNYPTSIRFMLFSKTAGFVI